MADWYPNLKGKVDPEVEEAITMAFRIINKLQRRNIGPSKGTLDYNVPLTTFRTTLDSIETRVAAVEATLAALPEAALMTTSTELNLSLGSFTASAWPAAQMALFVPFRINATKTITTVGRWVDAFLAPSRYNQGIYDANGIRLYSTGNQIPVSGPVQTTMSLKLEPGNYYEAFSSFDVALTHYGYSGIGAQLLGVRQMVVVWPDLLPASATFATLTTDYVPYLSLGM